jgi:hypothetical protein
MDEDELVKRYSLAKQVFDSIQKEVEEHFGALADDCKARKDIDGLMALIGRCPDNLTNVFIAMAIRELRGGHDG